MLWRPPGSTRTTTLLPYTSRVRSGRAAVIGDCIARVLDANGWHVRRKFYYNDAGVQIENLARSVQARAKGLTPDDDGWPEDGYRGDYIADVARDRKSTRLNSSH